MYTVSDFEKKIKRELKGYEGIPIAASGGIDSGVLAAIARPPYIISVKLPFGMPYDESPWSRKLAKRTGIKQVIVEPDFKNFDEDMKVAVKAIGRPIPHFNIFALYTMYKKLAEMGETTLIIGDGPDETMCGYTRHLIMKYLYFDMFAEPAFEGYEPMFGRILPRFETAYAQMIKQDEKKVKKLFDEAAKKGGNAMDCMCFIDMNLMRKDMDDMSNGIARHFGIVNIRPYQDNPEFDMYQYNMPLKYKVQGMYGKYLLRKVAEKYLPKEIAWRIRKVGGPVYPVNRMKGWMDKGEFDKTEYMKYQERILK